MQGSSNAEHFFVASQDGQLRGKLQQLPAGASIFASVNGVHLEQPSAEQRRAAGQVSPQVSISTLRLPHSLPTGTSKQACKQDGGDGKPRHSTRALALHTKRGGPGPQRCRCYCLSGLSASISCNGDQSEMPFRASLTNAWASFRSSMMDWSQWLVINLTTCASLDLKPHQDVLFQEVEGLALSSSIAMLLPCAMLQYIFCPCRQLSSTCVWSTSRLGGFTDQANFHLYLHIRMFRICVVTD